MGHGGSDFPVKREGASDGTPRHGCDILLAEDDEDCELLLTLVLSHAGYSVQTARTGTEALLQTRALRPALILMDWWMPELDGLECTRQIKKAPDLRDTIIVLLTASGLPADREQALAAGCEGFLPKPLPMEALLAEVRRWLPPRGEATH